MTDKIKILFLAANPIDVNGRLRLDEEYREISQKIRVGTERDSFELVSEWAVRPSDLQEALQRHRPHIVHFSGRGNVTEGIALEDDFGRAKPVNKQAFAKLFKILKDNIVVVVLNACYAKDQARVISRSIDFTVGMNAAIEDSAAIVFAAYFYQSLAFGRSVKEAFDLAVIELDLEKIYGAKVPKLLVRGGVNASEARIVRPSHRTEASESKLAAFGDQNVVVGGNISGTTFILGGGSKIVIEEPPISKPVVVEPERQPRPVAFLPWLFAPLAAVFAIDVSRRFLGDDGSWPDIVSIILQSFLLALATLAAILTVASLLRPVNPLARSIARTGVFGKLFRGRATVLLTGIAFLITLGLWLALPFFAHYYNEKGFRIQHGEPPSASGAREYYKQALRLMPSYSAARYNLALVYEDLHDDSAIQEYLLAIRYDSHIYAAYNNLARLYIRRGKDNDYENALNALSQAEVLSPQDEDTQYSLNKNFGWANYALKRYSLAEAYLRRAISLQNEDRGAAAHCLLAYVLKEQGKDGVADECFDCVRLARGEKGLETTWVSDAQEYLLKGEGK